MTASRTSRSWAPRRALAAALAAALCAAVAACVHDDATEPPEPKTPHGRFYVSVLGAGVWAVDTQVTLLGQLFDGPSPSSRTWHEEAKGGDCRLITPQTPFCDPGCGAGTACTEGGTCVAYPSALSAGKATVQGMKLVSGGASLTLSPELGVYQPKGTPFRDRPFTEGDMVTVSVAAGGGSPAFTMSTRGINVPEILGDSIILDGRDLNVRWRADDAGETPPPVIITLDASHHGGIKGLIECVTPDDGEAEIPGNLVNDLKSLGLSGFPHMVVLRRSVGMSPTQPVNLTLEAWNLKYATIPGLVSCTEDAQCPAGQTCRPDKQCQ